MELYFSAMLGMPPASRRKAFCDALSQKERLLVKGVPDHASPSTYKFNGVICTGLHHTYFGGPRYSGSSHIIDGRGSVLRSRYREQRYDETGVYHPKKFLRYEWMSLKEERRQIEAAYEDD